MDRDLDTLRLLAEVTIAFVAFSAIVASLRMNLGQKSLPFQKLLVQFFTVSGMLNVTFAILPLVLASFYDDERTIAFFSLIYTLAGSTAYLIYYLMRRFKIKAPTPLISALTMIGYAIWIPVLILVITGTLWEPTLGLIQAYSFWGLISSALIFAYFLSTFVDPTDFQSQDESD